MKKILGMSILAVLIIGFSAVSLFRNHGVITINDVPKDIPIINGKIVSTKTFRSDELKRGIDIEVETKLSLQEAAQYYNEEFARRNIRVFTLPAFQGNSPELENSTEASGGGETKKHQQVMVYLQSKEPLTLVKISILGNSILFLPE